MSKICLSVCKDFDPNYLRIGRTEWADMFCVFWDIFAKKSCLYLFPPQGAARAKATNTSTTLNNKPFSKKFAGLTAIAVFVSMLQNFYSTGWMEGG